MAETEKEIRGAKNGRDRERDKRSQEWQRQRRR